MEDIVEPKAKRNSKSIFLMHLVLKFCSVMLLHQVKYTFISGLDQLHVGCFYKGSNSVEAPRIEKTVQKPQTTFSWFLGPPFLFHPKWGQERERVPPFFLDVYPSEVIFILSCGAV